MKSKATKELSARHLASICAEVESLRGANGRIPRGAFSQILNLNKEVYSWLTKDIKKKCLKKREFSKDKSGALIKDTSIISDLTDEEYNAQRNESPAPDNIPPPTIVGTAALHDITNVVPKRGGRPKGATIIASHAKTEQRELLLDQITAEWREKVEVGKGRMKKKKSR